MDKKSIVYVILGLIIVFLAAFLIISHVSTTDFEQQTFTNFVMDVPKGTEFVETYDNYSTIYTSEDLEVKYFRVTNNDEAFHYAEQRTLIQSGGELVGESNGITEWKIDEDGKTKYVCFKEDADNNGACISVKCSNKDDCMRMAESIVFTNSAVFTEENSTENGTADNATNSTVSSNASQSSSNTTSTGNASTNGKTKIWSEQSNSYIYQESSSDGNIRQYDANGKLIGSTYDEDQAKLGNPDGNLE
mgnify:CR=1 FL=1|jgi:hypothetical protein